MEKETDSDRQWVLGRALASLAARLDAKEAAPLAERLATAMEKETDSDRQSALGDALASLAARLDVKEAAPLATRGAAVLVTARRRKPIVSRRLAVRWLRWRHGWTLKEAAPLAERLATAMEKETDSDRQWVLGRALASLAARLDAKEAAPWLYTMRGGVGHRDGEGNRSSVGAGRALASLAARLDAKEAAPLAERLTTAMEKETDSDRQSALGSALASLAARLDAKEAAPLAERLATAMEKETDSDRQSALGSALASLAARLDVKEAAPLANTRRGGIGHRDGEGNRFRSSVGAWPCAGFAGGTAGR